MTEKKWDWYPPKQEAPSLPARPVFVLVPFFQGKASSLKRHAEWLSSLGFPTAVLHLDFKAFDFDFNPKSLTHFGGLVSLLSSQVDRFSKFLSSPIKSSKKALSRLELASPEAGFGLKHVIADQIQHALNQIDGDKIVFAFSNISASAIEAVARRNAYDIRALICDSGPSGRISESIRAHYSEVQPVPFLPARLALAKFSGFLWSPAFSKELHQDLDKLPQNFPILSIRGWKDNIVKPDEIDSAFEPHSNLNWSKLSLPQAKHLNGFKDFSSTYCQGIVDFLDACGVSSAVNQSN